MQDVLNLYKPLGWTPLETLQRFKQLHPEYANVKMTYAGRLDPAAEGVLIVLTGTKVHEKETFLHLDKRYSAEILLGVETDSYDVLGLIKNIRLHNTSQDITTKLKSFIGAHTFPYPPYSSHNVRGKPLFTWTRKNKLSEIQIPERVMSVYQAQLQDVRRSSSADILQSVTAKVQSIKGDFRQTEILQSWYDQLTDNQTNFTVLKIDFHVASGTYIRTLAHELGHRLTCGASLFSLIRTAVGGYTIAKSDTSPRDKRSLC